jgi:hypothetical protein
MLREIKRPNLKAPRFRPCNFSLFNKEFCKKVRKQHKDLTGLSDEAIKAIIHTCGQVVQEKVVAVRDGVELPEQLGFLFIGSTPATKNGNIDYKKSIELGREVRHKNWETDELTGKIFYTNYGAKYRFKFREAWRFLPVRQFKRYVAARYPSNYLNYVKIDSHIKVSWMFQKKVRGSKFEI